MILMRKYLIVYRIKTNCHQSYMGNDKFGAVSAAEFSYEEPIAYMGTCIQREPSFQRLV